LDVQLNVLDVQNKVLWDDRPRRLARSLVDNSDRSKPLKG